MPDCLLKGGKTSSGSFIISVTDSEEPTNENFSKILKFLFDTIVLVINPRFDKIFWVWLTLRTDNLLFSNHLNNALMILALFNRNLS